MPIEKIKIIEPRIIEDVAEKKKVYLLECEDASGMGGPMGTEYTEHLWTKPFSSIEKAKKYAEEFIEKYWGKGEVSVSWKKYPGYVFWDARSHGFTIKPQYIM